MLWAEILRCLFDIFLFIFLIRLLALVAAFEAIKEAFYLASSSSPVSGTLSECIPQSWRLQLHVARASQHSTSQDLSLLSAMALESKYSQQETFSRLYTVINMTWIYNRKCLFYVNYRRYIFIQLIKFRGHFFLLLFAFQKLNNL